MDATVGGVLQAAGLLFLRFAQRTYGTCWQRMAAARGELLLDAVAASDVEAMKQ